MLPAFAFVLTVIEAFLTILGIRAIYRAGMKLARRLRRPVAEPAAHTGD
jgi:hypothetical protein